MNVVLGGGITGLLLAQNLKDVLVIENQPKLGGVFSYDEILDFKVPFHPPLLHSSCAPFNVKEVRLRIFSKKENYLLKKLNIQELPPWLFFKEKMYYVDNLIDIIDTLSKKVRVFHSNIRKINEENIITSKGIIKANKIFVTISKKFILESLGKKSNLKSISIAEIVAVIPKRDIGWDVYINGDNGVSFSHVINAYWLSELYNVLYVIIPFSGSLPIWDKIFSDLKREKILTKDEIIGLRSRIVRDAILIGDEENNLPERFKLCGRLGKWKNLTLCETVQDIHNC